MTAIRKLVSKRARRGAVRTATDDKRDARGSGANRPNALAKVAAEKPPTSAVMEVAIVRRTALPLRKAQEPELKMVDSTGTEVSGKEKGMDVVPITRAMANQEAFASILRDEIEILTKSLSPPLVGRAPVSAMLFQPSANGGRFVYLDRELGAEDPICLTPGSVAEDFFLAREARGDVVTSSVPWATGKSSLTQENLNRYSTQDAETRERLRDRESKRYQVQYDHRVKAPAVDTPYSMHNVFPSPFFHREVKQWRRLPRLGVIYTIGDDLDRLFRMENSPGYGEELLLMCATGVGNQALDVRLKMLFKPDDLVRYSPYAIGTRIATNEKPTPDEYLFLVARLLMAHHWFFPSSPVALQAFQLLGCDPNKTLITHGWPTSGLHNLNRTSSIADLIEELVQDCAFLVYAFGRWAQADKGPVPFVDLAKELRSRISEALSLICGQASYVVGEPSTKAAFLSSLSKGTINWYGSLSTPATLSSEVREFAVPVIGKLGFKDRSGTTLTNTAEAYLNTLSPAESPDPTKEWYETAELAVCDGYLTAREKRRGLWLTTYVRARCVLGLAGP